MKKTLFAIVSLAVLAMGCVKEQQPSEIPADSNKVTTLKVFISTTKIAVNETDGACTWHEDDQIAMWFKTENEGKRVVFTLETLNDDGTAMFTTSETIPEGPYSNVKIAHPIGNVKSDGSFGMITTYDYEDGKVPMYIRAESNDVTKEESPIKIEGNEITANLSQNGAIMKFTLHDVPSYATGFVVHANRNADDTGNKFDMLTRFPCKSGVETDLVIYSPVPGNSYPLYVYLVDSGNDMIDGTKKNFKSETKMLEKGDYIIMPDAIDFKSSTLQARDYVNVNGVKFAKGNLQYVSGAVQTGFQEGWRIAPSQWHHINYTLTKSTVVNSNQYDGSEYVDLRTNISNSAFEHFNGGGIGANSLTKDDGFITSEAKEPFNYAGKLYSDPEATAEVSGTDRFNATGTLYGDLAFWASKGVWRLPTAEELMILHNGTHKVTAKYTTSDGFVVLGYFYYPIVAEERKQGDYQWELTDKDLEYGVFLPYGGRRSNGTDIIIAITKQGTYWSGTYIKSGYSAYFHHSENKTANLYDDQIYTKNSNFNIGTAYDHKAGFMIRPVLAE